MKLRTSFYSLLPLAIVLSACGGSSSDESATSGDSSKSTTETTAALTLSLLTSSESQSATAAAELSTAQAKSYEDLSCQSGSVENTESRTSDVSSPYTSATFNVKTTVVADCAFGYAYDGVHVDSEGTQTLSGVLIGGQANDSNGSYAFLETGISDAPLSLALDSTTTFSGQQTRTLENSVDESLTMRLDRKINSGDIYEEWAISQEAVFGVSGTSNAGSFDRSGSYSLELGTLDEPFLYSNTNAGKTFDGSFHYVLDQQQLPDGCGDAMISVATTEPLVASGDDDAPYASGAIVLTDRNGDDIAMSFNGDGSVTVDDGETTETLPYLQLVSAADDCVSAITAAAQARAAQ